MTRQDDERPAASADSRSYYGRPVIKPPVWKVPDVPAYLYLGGMAGASSTMALCAELTGRSDLARVGRIAAAAGATISVAALMHDLGRPERFLNMLRVLKPTSPLSVGSWILATFSTLSGAAAVHDLTGRGAVPSRVCGAAAAALGPVMTTYTAVLLSDTAVPGWHEVHQALPFVFAGSAVASAGAVGMTAVSPAEAKPARRMALVGSVLELAAQRWQHRQAGLVREVYQRGRPGAVLKAARALTWIGAGTAGFAGRSRVAAVSSGLCLTVAAVATRYGIFEAGRESARDPQYTVRPQRRRRESRPVGASTGGM